MTQPPAPEGVLRTPLCDLLGIRWPIIQAPMGGGPTTPELVAAVSNAGGLGMLAAHRLSPQQVRDAIRATRERTDRPFGVNFLLAPPEPPGGDVAAVQRFLNRFREELGLPPGRTDLALPPSTLSEALAVVCEERVAVVSTALGDPERVIAPAQAADVRVMAAVATVEEALRAVERGVDLVVAQGAEAGGHQSVFELEPGGGLPLVGTLALVPQVVDAVKVPVLAAGGIADGHGVAAALALGAAGALLGTRFLVARESGAFPAYKERLLAATEADTVVTRAFTGRPARAVRNRFLDEYLRDGPEPLGWPLQALAAEDIYRAAQARGDADHYPLFAGEGLRKLKEGQGAAQIVAELVDEARACLVRLGQLA